MKITYVPAAHPAMRLALALVIAAVSVVTLAGCDDSVCKTEGKYRTRRAGHGIVHERCERQRGVPGLHWHESNATPPAPRPTR
jgi:hypothetical protein